MKEMEQLQLQAAAQRDELQAQIEKTRDDESFLRDHLSISVKENRRLETELLDTTEKLVAAENQIANLQTNIENIMKEKFGDLDPGSAEFFLQEERIKQLHLSYEVQCRELQDRIDELQSELNDFHCISRDHQLNSKTLNEELESKSPGNESDPGLGSEEVQPFSLSLEAEMMLEQLKDRHLQEMDELRKQMEHKISEFEEIVEKQRASQEERRVSIHQQHKDERDALRDEISRVQSRAEELQTRLDQVLTDPPNLKPDMDNELQTFQEEEIQTLRQQLLESHIKNADLDEQLKNLEEQLSEINASFSKELEELRKKHKQEITRLEQSQAEFLAQMEAERSTLSREFEEEKAFLKLKFDAEIEARLEQDQVRFEKERAEVVQRLTEQWEKERAQLDEENASNLQVLLEEEMLKLVKEHEDKEAEMKAQFELEKEQIQQKCEDGLLERLHQQTMEFELRERKLKGECDMEKAQLEEDFEGMVQERVREELEKMAADRDEEDKRFEQLMREERDKIHQQHQETVKELMQRHQKEREELHGTLDKLKEDIASERRQIASGFGLRLKQLEERFEMDQEQVAERFQADILKLEQNYQNELKATYKNHEAERHQWEEETSAILGRERSKMTEEWTKEMDVMVSKNNRLQSELDEIVRCNELEETDLRKQIAELQEGLEMREKFLSDVQKQAMESEEMLKETVQILQDERNELMKSQFEIEAKYKEVVGISEQQIAERIELLTERDDSKVKIEELERSMAKIQGDYDVERNDLQAVITDMEEKGAKWRMIKELQMQASQVLNFVQKVEMVSIEDMIDTGDIENVDGGYEITSGFDTTVSNSTRSTSSLGEESLNLLSPIEDLEFNINSRNDGVLSSSETSDVDESNYASRKSSPNQLCVHEQSQFNEKHLKSEIDLSIFNSGKKGASCANVDPIISECRDQKPYCGGDPAFKNKLEAVSSDAVSHNGDNFPRLERLEGTDVAKNGIQHENRVCCELKPQKGFSFEVGESMHKECFPYETVVDAVVLEDAENLGLLLEDKRSNCNSHNNNLLMPGICFGQFESMNESIEKQDVIKLSVLYKTTANENVLLQEKVSLLQQKIEILGTLLAHNNEKLKTGHQALEDNYSLKVKLLLFTEHIKELERKAFQMADLQIRYEDCACENSKLKEQNAELEKRVWSLESSLNIHGSPVTLADDIHRMRRENGRLSELLVELETPPGNLLMKRKKSRESTQPIQSGLHQLREDLEDRCCDFKLENAKLQRAMTDLQDQSHLLTKTSTVHRSEAYRLSEENLHLNKKINALKEDDLKDLMKTLATLKEEKDASERAADDYKKQISELQSQSVLLGNRNGILCEKNSQHLCDVEALKQQVAALAETKDQTKSEDKTQLSACVSALEAEMTKAANETASLKLRNSLLSQEVGKLREKLKSLESMENQMQTLSEEKNNLVKESQALCSQISKAQEKAKASEEALQAVTLQNSRLKADVRVLQQQKDTLQHEVALLHKKLQNTTEKNHVLERALHSTGLQSHSKKLLREELSRLMEQEQKLLKQENDKLQTEVLNAKAELRQARDKFRQMDSTIVSLKQHKQNQSAMLLTLEQENLTLKEELEAQKEKNKGREAGAAGPDTESILQENEALKSQMSRLSTQLIETFQAQLVGLLPPSPHRTPRGQQLREREEAENAQDDRERKMRGMEERMREIEASLHNVKLLLREKVVQLKDQLHKNGKADVLIKDLYSENGELLKALEVTEQRHKIAEKKNYLLEEKISSLTKIMRDLSPSTLPTLQYHFTCS
ncbi:unnamed protein product [Knipowitschia caucasica]